MLGLNCSLQLLKKSIYLKTLLTSEIIWGSFFIILFYFILFYFILLKYPVEIRFPKILNRKFSRSHTRRDAKDQTT